MRIRKNFLILIGFALLAFVIGITLNLTGMRHETLIRSSPDLPLEINLIEKAQLPQNNWPDSFETAALKGKYTIINFWASWCAPCLVEFPDLVRFARDHPDFNLVLVSNDYEPQAIERFTSSLDTDIRQALTEEDRIFMLHDPTGALTRDQFQSFKLPESYILDRNTKIIAKINGVLTEKAYDYLGTFK